MSPQYEPLTMYGQPSEVEALAWSWVEAQLVEAGAYWVLAQGGDHPHPRPVWGVWSEGVLHVSIGSPIVARLLQAQAAVTIHLDSHTDVVIMEGRVAGPDATAEVYEAYNAKYDWHYTVEEYGALTTITLTKVLAWRSAGWAGRDGFQQTGRWRF